jgi:hypothetical protein
MKYFVIYLKSTGAIIRWGSNPALDINVLETSTEAALEVDSNEVTSDTHYVDSGSLVAKTTKPSEYHKFNYTTKQWEADTPHCLMLLRIDRDNLLSKSDWTQVLDCPLTDSKKTEWATYRQQLRDLPLSYSNLSDLADVTWPTAPE